MHMSLAGVIATGLRTYNSLSFKSTLTHPTTRYTRNTDPTLQPNTSNQQYNTAAPSARRRVALPLGKPPVECGGVVNFLVIRPKGANQYR